MLPNAALEVLIDIFVASESSGILPPQLDATLVALLEKSTGGFRPIGIYQSLYRRWAKVRPALTKKWEKLNASCE